MDGIFWLSSEIPCRQTVCVIVSCSLLIGSEQNRLRFSWQARRDVALGVARALAYLLEEVQPHIIHRDIKASNILLDRNFTPKVSDFGLSKLLPDSNTHVSTRVAGTL